MKAPATTKMASAPGQRSFNLPEGVIRWRPLWPQSTAQILMNVDEYELAQCLQDGRLAWIFNISCKTAHHRAERRILAWCVFEILGNKAAGITPTADLSFERVVELIIGHHRPSLRSVELGRILYCQRKHIHELTRCRELKVIPEQLPRRGPTSSPRITRESVVAFLQRRRIT